MRPRWSFVVPACVALGACVSTLSSQVASGPPASRVLRAGEIATVHVRTAYEAVQQLRPQFLRWTRGPEHSADGLVVYVDGVRRGGVEELNHLPAALVREIRFLTAMEATTLYGMGHTVGALDIRTGPPRR